MVINLYDVYDKQSPKLKVLNSYNIAKKEMKTKKGVINVLNKYLNLDREKIEYMYAVGFDYDKNPTGIIFAGRGDERSIKPDIPKIFYGIILMEAKYFMCFHNHPHGVREISDEDIELTNFFNKVSQASHLEFLGHYMITQNYYKECK